MINTSISINSPNSACEYFLQANIVERNRRGQYSKERSEAVQNSIHYILTNAKKSQHENHFLRLLPVNSSLQKFTKEFERIKSKILKQTEIFEKQINKPKYQMLDNLKIPEKEVDLIKSFSSELITKLNQIECLQTYKDMIEFTVQNGTQCILESTEAKKTLSSEDAIEEFYKNIAENIFKEECKHYGQYSLKQQNIEGQLNEADQIALEGSSMAMIAKIVQEIHQNNKLGTMFLRTTSVYRSNSRFKLKASERPLKKGDVVMYSEHNPNKETFFGRILAVNDESVSLRKLNGKEETFSRDRIIQQF